MMRIESAAASDVGKLRRANEDAFWQGASVFAVADGMGGHVAGEVASSTALEPIATLDGKVFGDGTTALSELCTAVKEANELVARKAAGDPMYRGMGTTLTVVMLEGRRLHLAHVGDSRAYLLRNGHLDQITHDHTLVQHLIDEGQLTHDEAAVHPQRSIITRAIGVALDVEVDAGSLELESGDQLLLCSDGLTGVVPDGEIARMLEGADSLETAVGELVGAALDAGGPDNITVVLLRFGDVSPQSATGSGVDVDTGELPDSERGEGQPPREDTGELDRGLGRRVVVRTGDGPASEDWAKRLSRIGSFSSDRDQRFGDDDVVTTTPGRRTAAIALAVAVLLLAALGGGRWLLSRSYYVGLAGDRVAIYQGVPGDLGPFELSWVSEATGLTADEVPDFYRNRLDAGIPAADLADARRIIENSPRRDAADDDTTDAPSAADDGGSTAP